MSHHSDDIVLQGIRNRDNGAFKYLQVKFQDSIRLMVMEMGGSQEEVDVPGGLVDALREQLVFRRRTTRPRTDAEHRDDHVWSPSLTHSAQRVGDHDDVLESRLPEISL